VFATAVSLGVVPIASVPAGVVPSSNWAKGLPAIRRRAHRLDVDTRSSHVAGAVLASAGTIFGELKAELGGSGLPVLTHLAGGADRRARLEITVVGGRHRHERQVERSRSGCLPHPDAGGTVRVGFDVGPVGVEDDEIGCLVRKFIDRQPPGADDGMNLRRRLRRRGGRLNGRRAGEGASGPSTPRL
jgi:hypothetical protein